MNLRVEWVNPNVHTEKDTQNQMIRTRAHTYACIFAYICIYVFKEMRVHTHTHKSIYLSIYHLIQ